MGEENSHITPETVEKIISSPDILRLLLNTDSENYSIANNGKELAINFLLCDVVIENVFAGRPKSKKGLDNYNKITIYFKPSYELKAEFRSKTNADRDTEGIMNLLKKVSKAKQKLTRYNEQIEIVSKQLEQQNKEKAVLEAKIFDITKAIKIVPKKPVNRRFIFIKRRELMNLNDELLKVSRTYADISQCLNELLQARAAMENEININIDGLLEILSKKYEIEKIGLS